MHTKSSHGPRAHGVFVWDSHRQCYVCTAWYGHRNVPPPLNPAPNLLKKRARRS